MSEETPSKKAFRYEIRVVWSDLDAKGHVSNLMFPVYLESARTAYYLGLLRTDDPMRIDFILARIEIDFEAPAFYNDLLEVWVRPSRVGNTSFDLEYAIVRKSDHKLIARSRSVQVCLDYRTRKKKLIPKEVAERLKMDMLCTFFEEE